MLTIACVLKSGGEFKPEHVTLLHSQVRQHVDGDYRFVCLSDVDVPDVEIIPLTMDLPKHWSQIELFQPGLFEDQVFYLDLDTVVVKNITAIVNNKIGFCILSDFARILKHRPASGLMAFNPHGAEYVWEQWEKNDVQIFKGDHVNKISKHFFWPYVKEFKRFQELYPGQIVSYKKHCLNGVPPEARIICYHGEPKPWDVQF